MTFRSCSLWLLAALLVFPATARCEERTDQLLPSPITLEGAVNYALAHQPILRAQGAQDEAADAREPRDRERGSRLAFFDGGHSASLRPTYRASL